MRRELGSLASEKTILFAIVVQLLIASLSSVLVVGLAPLYDPGSAETESATIGVTGEVTADLKTAADELDTIRIRQFPTEAAALANFSRNRVDAVLTTRVEQTATGPSINVVAVAPAENVRTTRVVGQLRELLLQFERIERTQRAQYLQRQPVEMPPRPTGSSQFGFTYTVLVPLLIFFPVFISGSLAVDIITEELEQGTLALLRVAPVSLLEIFDGKAAAMTVIAVLQAAVWLVLLGVNGIPVGHPVVILLFTTALAIALVTLGVVLGAMVGGRKRAQLLYSECVFILFGVSAVLPDHPSTLITKLAINSAALLTYVQVACILVASLLGLVSARYVVPRIGIGKD